MKCAECGKKMKKKLGTHHYAESGLDNINLENIPIYGCTCGNSVVGIPAIVALHEQICIALVSAPVSLKGQEIKFIRSTMGLRANEFAKLMRVHKGSVSRWENDKVAMNRAAAHLFKLLVLDHFSKERKRVIKMLEDITITEEAARKQIEKSIAGGKESDGYFKMSVPSLGKKAKLALELVA